MKHTHTQLRPELYNDISVPAFGYELLKNVLIPDLLGDEALSILYWSGRKIARRFPLESLDEITAFFSDAGWGTLEMVEKDKKQMKLELHSELITARLKGNPETVFTLEAGFIAESLQQQLGCVTEVYTENDSTKEKKAVFTARWDAKDPSVSQPDESK